MSQIAQKNVITGFPTCLFCIQWKSDLGQAWALKLCLLVLFTIVVRVDVQMCIPLKTQSFGAPLNSPSASHLSGKINHRCILKLLVY